MAKEIGVLQRQMNLIQYLPKVLQETREIEAITTVENPKFQKMWAALDGVLKDQFVLDATINGVKRWESMLSLYPKDTENLDARKQRILTRLGETLPYTYRRLEDWLKQSCGENAFSLELENTLYQLTIRLIYEKAIFRREIFQEARKIIPANMVVQELITSEAENAILSVGTCCTLAVYTVIEPYTAGSYETENTLYLYSAISCGIRGVVG